MLDLPLSKIVDFTWEQSTIKRDYPIKWHPSTIKPYINARFRAQNNIESDQIFAKK